MQKTLAEIAKLVEGEVVGDKNLVISGLSSLQDAVEGDITFIAEAKYIAQAQATKASAIVASRGVKVPGKSLIHTDNPSFAFAQIASLIAAEDDPFLIKGVDATAVVDPTAKIGKNVAIGAHAVIEADVVIGDNSIVSAGCFIGHHSQLGKNVHIYPNVTVYHRTSIANRVSIHSGSVIGSDGYGYVQVDGKHSKIPQIGIVVIEDDVEIGANVAIDRARFDKTVIGCGTKIDNLVHIAHNVIIGEHCLIVGQVGISGSVTIGKGAILAGQVGVTGHVHIGEGAIVKGKSGVTNNLEAHTTFYGFPAKPEEHTKRANAAFQRLPIYVKKIRELEQRIADLEKEK